MKYIVLTTIAVNTWEEVEANSPEEAAEKSTADFSLCCQCSLKGDLGDPIHITVLDEEGNEMFRENL